MSTREYLPPVDQFLARAFGGSIDKDKPLKQILIAEAKEEAGYVVEERDIYYVGKQFVSSMMNQYCYLFIVNLTGKEQQEREPENAVEALATPVWRTYDEICNEEDWKAISIATKYLRKLKRG